MSKGSLFWGQAVGKLGESVFYRAGGQQRNRAYVHNVKNPKTRSQMTNRIKWANVINTWRLLKPFLMMGMQNRKTSQSDYNKFVGLNVSASRAYLLKEQAQQGGTVLAPYIITSGSLGLRSMRSAAITGINVGNVDLSSATIGQLSAAIIANNTNIAIGDQITVMGLGQTVVEGVPYVLPYAYKFVVSDAALDAPALEAIEVSGAIAPAVEDGFLAFEFVGVEYSEYAGAVIQSRIDGDGSLLVSDSRLVVAYEIDGVQQGTNPFAVTEEEALASYGFSAPVYLNPASAGEVEPRPRSLITGVTQSGNAIENGGTISVAGSTSAIFRVQGQNFDVSTLAVTVGGSPVNVTIESATAAKFDATPTTSGIAVVVTSASNVWSFTAVRS